MSSQKNTPKESSTSPLSSLPKIAMTTRQLGIVNQLFTTRVELLLKQHGTSLSQFSILQHLANSTKKQHSISEITEVMEMNQPGVTKIVRKLSEDKLLNVVTDKNDSRKRLVNITENGYKKIQSVSMALYPDVKQWFEDWDDNEIDTFTHLLNKLATWLDKNRL